MEARGHPPMSFLRSCPSCFLRWGPCWPGTHQTGLVGWPVSPGIFLSLPSQRCSLACPAFHICAGDHSQVFMLYSNCFLDCISPALGFIFPLAITWKLPPVSYPCGPFNISTLQYRAGSFRATRGVVSSYRSDFLIDITSISRHYTLGRTQIPGC